MAETARTEIRNLAVIAHVDHGKTTLVDAMLWQSERFHEVGEDSRRVLDSLDPDRQKSINVMVKTTSLLFRETRINIIDTPSRADFGRDVERALKLVDGVLLVVDGREGPLPQTRFALRKALEAGLAPIVIVTKIDHPGARPAEVVAEVRALLVDLEADERQLRFPVLYCNALRGACRREPDGEDESLLPLFELILEAVPAPVHDTDGPLQFLVTLLDYDDFLGRLALGRVFGGSLRKGSAVALCRLDGSVDSHTVSGLYRAEGLRRVEIEAAGAGEIVAVTGLAAVEIGETLCDPARPAPLPPLKVDEPTLAMVLSVNDSPMAGLEGHRVSGSSLRERLWAELLTNVSVRVEETDSPDAFELSGRDELQLVMLIEMMRREGFELQVGRPRVVLREIGETRQEPMELLVVDCPESYSGVVGEKIAARAGRMTKMVNHGTGRVRMEFRIPSRGLIGFRTEYLRDTKGSGILNHMFEDYEAWQGEIPQRSTGALVAEGPGRATAFAIEHFQSRGTIFVGPGEQVYEGMIVGENSRSDDLVVNIAKEKRPTVAGSRPGGLIPPRSMSLEQALEFIRDDELVEVTPRAVRMRKRLLQNGLRGRKS
jgi:GTP-binding protein